MGSRPRDEADLEYEYGSETRRNDEHVVGIRYHEKRQSNLSSLMKDISYQRADRVLSFFSSRPNWGPPPPHTRVCNPPLVPEGGWAFLPAEQGVGVSQFGRGGIHCGTLSTVYLYFVFSTFVGTNQRQLNITGISLLYV